MADGEKELLERTKWALDMEAQLKERTEWAISLEKDVAHHVDLAKTFQAEARERTQWALSLQAQLDVLQARLTRLQASLWTKAGRRVGMVKP